MKKKALVIMAATVLACAVMALVDGVVRPGYLEKSAIKMALFLLLPFAYSRVDPDFHFRDLLKSGKKGIFSALGIGVAVYAVVLGAYFLFRNVFDFSGVAGSVTAQNGVTAGNFLYVALYISFVNSFLEEFFFRGFAFLTLKKHSTRGFCYVFSAGMFALYHIAMMIGWFDAAVLLLTLLGLFAGGIIFNFFDEKADSIWLSWLIHMFANFAINTIGFLLFRA